MRCKLILFITLLLLCMLSSSLFSQENSHSISDSSEISPDYLSVSLANIESHVLNKPDYHLIDTDIVEIHHYDPILKNINLYQSLGIFGQAHKSMKFDFNHDIDFVYIQNPYPLYFKKQSDIKFYELATTYTKLSFIYGIPKENYFNLDFAQKIKRVTLVTNLYANYNDGYFLHQKINNLVGNVLLHYEIPSQIYGFRASYIINHLENQENGGLLYPLDFINQTENTLQGYNVFSSKAIQTVNTHDVLFQQYVNLKDKKKRYYGTFTHAAQYKQYRSAYFDAIDSARSYPALYLSIDTTADTLSCYSIINSIQYSNFSPFDLKEDKDYFIHFTGGFMHEYFVDRRFYYSFNSLTPFARANIRLLFLDLSGSFSYSFMGYCKDNAIAHLSGQWAVNRTNNHFLGVRADFFRVSPDYIFSYKNSNYFSWDTLWKKQNVMQLGTYWKFRNYCAEINYFMLSNYSFFNNDLQPTQLKNIVNLIQGNIYIPFRYKGFGATLNITTQYADNDSIQIPVFAGKLSSYYVFKLFKRKLQLQIGLDLFYNTSYCANGYSPALNQFYYQDKQKTANYFYFDAYANFRVERIYFFFRFGNLLSSLQKYNMFTTPNYPMKDYNISIGINWRFHD